MYKTNLDNVVVYGLKTKFGGGSSTGFALVYDTIDDRKKFDAHYRLVRDDLATPVDRNRREKKDLRLRMKKLWATDKLKAK